MRSYIFISTTLVLLPHNEVGQGFGSHAVNAVPARSPLGEVQCIPIIALLAC